VSSGELYVPSLALRKKKAHSLSKLHHRPVGQREREKC
jgi:hypothetical protein